MKPVFLIAIVAVAMIGVMVPSVFASSCTIHGFETEFFGRIGGLGIDDPNRLGGSDIFFDDPRKIGINSNDELYVIDRSMNKVNILDSEFLLNRSFPVGSDFIGGYEGIEFISDDSFYLLHSARGGSQLQKYSSADELLETWGKTPSSNGVGAFSVSDIITDFSISNFFIDKSENIYLFSAENEQKNIYVFSKNGNQIQTIKDVEIPQAQDIDGNFYSINWSENTIIKYNSDFEKIFETGSNDYRKLFSEIHDIAVGDDGFVYVVGTTESSTYQGTQHIFDTDGNYMCQFGTWKGASLGSDEYSLPSDIAIDSTGKIFVSDRSESRPAVFVYETILIPEPVVEPISEPVVEPTSLGIASFVDTSKDPQHYIDRYNNEPAYKEWFDENYPQYSSIYEAVGMEKPTLEPVAPTPVVEPIVEQKIISNSEREQMMSLMYQGLAIANVDFDKSLEYLKKATQIDLTNLEVQQTHDRIYDSKQTTTTQISNLNEKIKNNPEQNKDKADDLRNKGFALIKMGNYDDALTTCQESLKIIPNYSSLSCVQKSIVFKEDWNEYLKQVELYPGLNRQANDPYGDTRGTDFGTIRAYYNLQDYDTALKMINTALTFENDMTKFNLHIYKNVVLEKMNAKPTNNDIMVDDFFMAAIFFTLHDWEKAIYYIEKLETESPERLYASDSRSPLLDSKIIANYYLEKNSNVQLTSDVKSTTQFTPEPTVRDSSMPNCGPGTESVNGICEVIQTAEKSSGGGCLIATATYGSELSPQVQQLRELRDNQLLNTESGKQFMSTFNDIYYSFSPIIADYERENPLFKEAVKLAITPMLSSLSLMDNAETESEVLSMGLSVIMLNIGMYLGVPAVLIVGIRKRI